MEDRIERTIDLKAPVERVWRAVTDHEEFGEWFKVALEGPFVVGEMSRGQITYPGCEHMKWRVIVKAMEKDKLFAFSWCPYDLDPDTDPKSENHTLVEFRLEPTSSGTRLTISESGFTSLPEDPENAEAFRRNSGGWDGQVENIKTHVE